MRSRMADSAKILIIGAGPCGLGAAAELLRLGHENFVALEKETYPGGLSASFVDSSGFVWDLGGHVVFSHYDQFDQKLDEVIPEWVDHERESWILTNGRWVPYPFQYNVHRLGKTCSDAVLRDLEERSGGQSCQDYASFADWITGEFGPELERLFMRPYNLKVWGYPLEDMGISWLGERVAGPDYERVRTAVENDRDDCGWGPNSSFRFPATGGTGAIWRGVAEQITGDRILYNSEVRYVDLDRKELVLDDGSTEKWDTLISSMPLDIFVRRVKRPHERLASFADGLHYSSTHVVGVGLRGGKPDVLAEKCWMYFPDRESPYYRVTHFSHYAPGNAPAGCWSLMAEVCETSSKHVDHASLASDVINSFRRDGLIESGAEIVSTLHRCVRRGYPVPTVGRDAILKEVLPVLEAKNVLSRGRFGGWKYEVGNMDHCYMQGVEAARRLVTGEPESVFQL